MRWPRGRYNGWRIIGVEFKFVLDVTSWEWLRIIGVEFKFVLDVTSWEWLPIIGHHCGMFHWLCFRTWTQLHYDQFNRKEKR